MAENSNDIVPHPNLKTAVPEMSDSSPVTSTSASHGTNTLTLSTIASSVSNLAVIETLSDPDIFPLTTEKDMCCCPPKRIRISDSGDGVQTDSLQHSDLVDQPEVQNACEKEGGKHKSQDNKNLDHLSGVKVSVTHSFGCIRNQIWCIDSVESSPVKTGKTEQIIGQRGIMHNAKFIENDCSRLGSQHATCLSFDTEHKKALEEGGLSWRDKGSKMGVVLSPSPHHYHDIAGKLTECLGEQSDCHGSVRVDQQQRSSSKSGDALGQCSGINMIKTSTAVTPAYPARLAALPSSLRFSVPATYVRLNLDGCSTRTQNTDVQAAVKLVDSSTVVSTETERDVGSYTSHLQSVGAEHTNCQPSSDVSMDIGSSLPKTIGADFSVDQNLDTGASTSAVHRGDVDAAFSSEERDSSSSSTWFCGKNGCSLRAYHYHETARTSLSKTSTCFETGRSWMLPSNTDEDTDSSGCSESSSYSSSSSESSPRQSSVASARIFHRRLQCTKLQSKKQGKKQPRWNSDPAPQKKKTPRCTLKTDPLNISWKDGCIKSKNLSCTSKALKHSRYENSHLMKNDLTIDDLPPVLLVHIFSFLPVVTRISCVSVVCKRWQSVVLDPSLWRHLELWNLPRLTDSRLLTVASLSDRVSSLILSGGHSTLLTDDGVARVLRKCQYLTKIKLNRCFFLSDDAFEVVGKSCHNLVHLNLNGCFTVTDRTLLAIGEGCPLLQDLGLRQCARITDTGICAVAKGCPRLLGFHMDQCGKMTDRGVEALANHCPDLQFLHLLSCALTDAGICHLSKLGKLQVLDISNVTQLSRKMVEMVVTCCPLLEKLALSLNRTVDDQCLRQVVTCCPRLSCLSCVACGVSDMGLHHIATHAKNLERLDVAWCTDITDAGVAEVSAACPKLRYLGVMRCPLVTMATVERLMQAHPSIHYSNFELESRRLLGRATTEQGTSTSER